MGGEVGGRLRDGGCVGMGGDELFDEGGQREFPAAPVAAAVHPREEAPLLGIPRRSPDRPVQRDLSRT